MSNICPYCGDDAGLTPLGERRLSHPHHRPGTPFWEDWYRAMRDQGLYRSEIGDMLLAHRERMEKERRTSLAKLHDWQRRRGADDRAALGDDGPDEKGTDDE